MRAHSQRRILWIVDFALALVLLGVLGWYFADVRGAVADSTYLSPQFAKDAIRGFEAQPAATQSALRPPVSQEELQEIDLPGYRKGTRRWWWLYSGPKPPPPPEDPKPEERKAPVVSELERLGKVWMLLYFPPRETVLSWRFTSGKVRYFKVGEWIRENDRDRASLKLLDVRRKGGDVYEIVYGVFEDPEAEQPTKEGILVYDASPPLPEDLRSRIRVPAERSVTGAEAPEGSSLPAGGSGATAGVVEGPQTTADAEPTIDDLQPTIVEESFNQSRVEFDQKTFDFFRRTDADSVAKTIKTQVAKDKNGKVLGLQITGMGPDSPAQKFDIRPGDILVSIDGRPVESRSDAINIVQQMDPNVTRVTVVIDRSGLRKTYVIDPRDPETRRRARYLDER